MQTLSEIEIDLSEIEDGLKLFIDSEKTDALFLNEATNNYEAKYQIKEGCFYDYTFSKNGYRLKCFTQNNIVSQRKRDKHTGQISPNIYVGTLLLDFFHKDDESKKGTIELEVQSIKTSYREDYQFMLNEIAEKCTDLILQANSPVSHTFETNPESDNETLYQRFAFIKAMIESEDFENAIQRIIISPVTKWQNEFEQKDVRRIKKFSSQNIRQLIHGSNRIKLSSKSSLSKYGINSIATKIQANNKIESVDTAENRFIKHALKTFFQFCGDLEMHKNAGIRLKSEAKQTSEILSSFLEHHLFKEISRPSTLKLNSPILQKKSGYREVLKTWLNFDLAAKLIWTGGDEVYKGGKKDIATLYEYWLFFKLLEVLENIFKIKPKDLSNLIKPSQKGLNLQLKQGEFTPIKGIYIEKNRDLNIKFNYNRSFKFDENINNSGSWSTSLRPDYTLSIWPKEISETKAEATEQIVHIHFDAKYKVANIHQIIVNKNDDELNTEKKEHLKGDYKNADLLKMHAYKDAIRRTAGAYVLYPGTEDKKRIGFHEILPGLGAFPVKPSKNENSTLVLEAFIKEVLEHFLNRVSQREKIAIKTYEAIKDGVSKPLNESLPEYINKEKLIPDETYVLVGYCKSKKHLEWYDDKGIYNFRMNDTVGSLVLDEKTVKAKYLLLRYKGEANKIFKIISKGPKVYSKEKLLEMDYPKPSENEYLIIDIEKETTNELGFFNWDFKNLDAYKFLEKKETNLYKLAGIPFTVSLTELMYVKQ